MRVIEFLGFVLLAACALDSRAGEYEMVCDRATQEVRMQVGSATEAGEGRRIFPFDPDKLARVGGTESRPLQLRARSYRAACTIGRHRVALHVDPLIQNTNVMGRCGAADLSIRMTLRVDGRRIVHNLGFENDCHVTNSVSSLSVNLRKSTIRIAAIQSSVEIERSFSFEQSSAPDFNERIYSADPTGNAKADLLLAVKRRDLAGVEKALSLGGDPNLQDLDGYPPLADPALVREIPDTNSPEDARRSAVAIIGRLIAAGADPNAPGPFGFQPLVSIIQLGAHIDVVDALLRGKADVNRANAHGETPLMIAAWREDATVTRRLLAAGAQSNVRAKDGATALTRAVQIAVQNPAPGPLDIVRVLLPMSDQASLLAAQDVLRKRGREDERTHTLWTTLQEELKKRER